MFSRPSSPNNFLRYPSHTPHRPPESRQLHQVSQPLQDSELRPRPFGKDGRHQGGHVRVRKERRRVGHDAGDQVQAFVGGDRVDARLVQEFREHQEEGRPRSSGLQVLNKKTPICIKKLTVLRGEEIKDIKLLGRNKVEFFLEWNFIKHYLRFRQIWSIH
jgi:hypothetical protein